MGIVDDLLANPGTYLGLSHGHGTAAARIVVTALPGGAAVSVDYETFDPSRGDAVQGHAEHALVGRTDDGGAVLVSAHVHAGSVTVLRETAPGMFTLRDEPSTFPMAIRIDVPEPGRLVYAWSYGGPGEEPVERDRAEVTRVS